MEQTYAEAIVKKKSTSATLALKIVFIALIAVVFIFSFLLNQRLILLVGVAGIFALVWYWPRFKVEWEYVYCDGQIDFDMIQGGEKRKNVLRIEIEDADAIAPIDSPRLDGYRHLEVKDYSSLRPDANVYGIATRLKENADKVLIKFEPTGRMVECMYNKCPNVVEKPKTNE